MHHPVYTIVTVAAALFISAKRRGLVCTRLNQHILHKKNNPAGKLAFANQIRYEVKVTVRQAGYLHGVFSSR